MQTDGNFVVYDVNNEPKFATNTDGHPGDTLHLQDDGNLVLYDSSNNVLWHALDILITNGDTFTLGGPTGGQCITGADCGDIFTPSGPGSSGSYCTTGADCNSNFCNSNGTCA